MKKCEQFKDLILTDYIDAELDRDSAGNLENHLLDCSDCRAFFKEFKNNVAMPFQQAPHQPVPAEIWDTIKKNIEDENQRTNPIADLIDRLRGLIVFPKMVPVFASFALMFLAGSATLETMHVQQAQAKDQGEYLVSLLSTADASNPSDSNSGSTPIEHYFL